MAKVRYSDFFRRIDVDAFESAIGFEPIEQKDNEDRGHCPDFWGFHKNGDTTGKFSINRAEKVYNCWVCGGGSLLSLAMEFLRTDDADEATHWLKQFTLENRTDDEFVAEFLADLDDVEERVETLPYFNLKVLDRWESLLNNAEMAAWIYRKWGIDAATAERFKMRYDPEHTRRGKDEVFIGPALIFPHFWMDRLVGWQARWLDDDEDRPKWVPKYTNTPDFPRDTVYNYANCLRSKEPIIVVESAASTQAIESYGYSSAATFGSNVRPTTHRLLRRFSQGIIFWPDNDKPEKPGAKSAGTKWLEANIEYMKRFIPVRCLPPVPGKPGADAADLAANGTLDLFIEDNLYDPLLDELT